MKFSDIERGMCQKRAAGYVGGLEVLKEFERLYGLRPYIRKNNRLTRYDRVDLDRCIERQKADHLIEKEAA